VANIVATSGPERGDRGDGWATPLIGRGESQRVVAFAVPREEVRRPRQGAATFRRGRLDRHKVAERMEVVGDLPRTPAEARSR
jgi:acyl-CoA synthetase (AMP-forming)/AMP-acid ligase II